MMQKARSNRAQQRGPEDQVVNGQLAAELKRILDAPVQGFYGLRLQEVLEDWTFLQEEQPLRYEELIGTGLSHALADPRTLAAIVEFVDPRLLEGRCRGCCGKLPPRKPGTRGRNKHHHEGKCRTWAHRNRQRLEKWRQG
ncbi:MAG: hypothetical protein HOQ44_24050 [Nocardia sp.]|nr:hypothetical protein [Nocardia sp.]